MLSQSISNPLVEADKVHNRNKQIKRSGLIIQTESKECKLFYCILCYLYALYQRHSELLRGSNKYAKCTLKTGIQETLVNRSSISTLYFPQTLYKLLKPTLDLYLGCVS